MEGERLGREPHRETPVAMRMSFSHTENPVDVHQVIRVRNVGLLKLVTK
jgi:hypothetical protein